MVLDALSSSLAAHGLRLRGGFHPRPADGVPLLPDGTSVGTLVLVGNAGAEMWARFAAHEASCGATDPLDTWTRDVLEPLAAAHGAVPLYPFGGPPHLPFQRWAMRAEDVHVSPLRLLIHPEYGLWHAYRAALAFADVIALPPRLDRSSPCDACTARPCLAACPVVAFDVHGFSADRCLDHLSNAAGADCMDDGCRARRACPVGATFRQSAAQRSFHQRAFFAAARRRLTT